MPQPFRGEGFGGFSTNCGVDSRLDLTSVSFIFLSVNCWEASPQGGQIPLQDPSRTICPSIHGICRIRRLGCSKQTKCVRFFHSGQVCGHRTVSLFSGCLGLELGWKQSGSQLDQPQTVYYRSVSPDLQSVEVHIASLLCEWLSL